MKARRSNLLTIGVTALATAAVTIFARNFISGEKKVKRRVAQRYGIADPQFERSMSQLLGPPILHGNLVTPLRNGAQIFPAMLAAIESAERSITFETFIYWSGRIAEKFADALAARARRGVKVHVLVDGVGCNCVNGEALRQMVDAGVEVEVYHLANFARTNHRTHRKLLVVDGRIGFTGGVGIADEWDGHARSPDEWRDSHYRVEGPVVAQMQAAFLDNWMKTRAVVLHGEEYFPELHPAGNHRCQIFKSSPMEGSESARLMYLLSITAAEQSLRVGNAYFVPDDLISEALIAAVERGVSVEILVPGRHMDSTIVRAASRHRWGGLLERGVRIFEFEPTMYHCKVMVIDGLWTSVGSANFDNRSFRLNDEANLNVINREIAAGETRAFKEDKARAREVTHRDWLRRPAWQRAADAGAALLRSQL
ncbi:MAG: phospholipase D-like domain-containing protein [Chthoniobacteraceae bacterium]